MIRAYCIRRRGEPPPAEGLTGAGGAAVRLVEEGEIGAWISVANVGSGDVDSLRAHDAVVRAALRSATPLPVRFDTLYPDEHALRASLREAASSLQAALERVAGHVEMGVRVEWRERQEAAPSEKGAVASGREYLERRRREFAAHEAQRARATKLLDRVEARVAPQGDLGVRTLLPAAGVAGSMAHLVHRQAVGVYRTRAAEAQAELPEVTLRVSGPWAPYSFV